MLTCRVLWLAALVAFHTASAGDPPRAKTIAFSETIHGQTIADPYRWMEGSDPDYLSWLKAQEAHARTWLASLPRRAALLQAIEARSGAAPSLTDLQFGGNLLFLARRGAGAQRARLYVRALGDSTERLLFDPASQDSGKDSGHAINYWEASPNGRYVYVGVSSGGSELATLRLIDVPSGKLLPEAVPLALFNYSPHEMLGSLYPQWLPDSSGFFYNRLAEGARPGTDDFFSNSRVFLHKVGTAVAADTLIAAAGKDSKLGLPPIVVPTVIAQQGSRHALLVAVFGVQRALSVYVAPLDGAMSGQAAWKPVASGDDQVEGAALAGDDIYLLRRDRARGRVMKTRAMAPSLQQAQEVLPEGDAVIDRIITAKGGIYVIERAAKGTHVRHLSFAGALTTARLPFDGISYFHFGSPQSDALYLSLENYVTPQTRLRIAGADIADSGLAPRPAFPADAYVSETVLVRARDGARVPLDITRRRDTPRDGKRPVLLEAYGAYGVNLDPYFAPRLFALLDQGAIHAAAHVRGGGEMGNDWWKGGFQATKPNTWRDAIDCAQWLIDQGWSARRKITVWGASAGGIMAGRALTERPDLWAGAIVSVGILNPLRFEFAQNGPSNVPEFGSVETLEGFRALQAMDAYHAIRDGVAYPPVLLTAGMNDQRVVTWQPAKFVARMQASATGGPVIFKVDTDQGHGIGSQRSQIDNDTADVYAFTLWAAERNR